MITIFNREEVLITYDMGEQTRVRDLLAANDIDYIVRVKNIVLHNGVRVPVNSFVHQQNMYEYKIYVRKKDYEKAMFVLRK